MKAVSHAGPALRFASEVMRGDRQMVMTAVLRWGYALHYATVDLRGDADMIEVALANNREVALVALRVSLLSGRFCNQIYTAHEDIGVVLRECAALLES